MSKTVSRPLYPLPVPPKPRTPAWGMEPFLLNIKLNREHSDDGTISGVSSTASPSPAAELVDGSSPITSVAPPQRPQSATAGSMHRPAPILTPAPAVSSVARPSSADALTASRMPPRPQSRQHLTRSQSAEERITGRQLSAPGSTPLCDALHAYRIAPRKAPQGTTRPVLSPAAAAAHAKAVAAVKSGMLAAPTLISQKPVWWRPPPTVVVAADKFDDRHRSQMARAERALKAVGQEPHNAKKKIAFTHSVTGVNGNRYFVPEKVQIFTGGDKMAKARAGHEVIGKRWMLETSIWAPRKKNADSGSFYDTEELMRKTLELDWKLALESHNNIGFITQNDKSAETADVTSSMFDTLWQSVWKVYGAYDFYATVGSTYDDVVHVKKSGYKQLIIDCNLIIKDSQHCNPVGFDQLFVLLNSNSDYPLALNRQEWLQMLMRIATRRYVFSGKMKSMAAALKELLEVDIFPKVDKRCLRNTSEFRRTHCYLQDVDEVLRDYEPSLRALFKIYAKGDGTLNDELKSSVLLDFIEWRHMLRDLMLIDDDFRDREAALTFVWSRMRVVDERPLKSRVKLTQLSFEAFLDALVQMACIKIMPTQEQCFDAGCSDAGEFILQLRKQPVHEYAKFITTGGAYAKRDKDGILDEGFPTIVGSLIYVIIRTIKTVLAKEAAKGFQTGELIDEDDYRVDAKQVQKFKTINLQDLGDNPFGTK